MDPILSATLGVLVGGLIGHRFALFRDKRKEFNQISEPIFVELENQLLAVNQGSYPICSSILSDQELITFKRFLSSKEKSKFNSDLSKYRGVRKSSKSQKDFVENFHSPEKLALAIVELQKYLKRR